MFVRTAAATREDIDHAVYETLARDPHVGVRATVAGNPAIGADLCEMLAHDTDDVVRDTLRANPGCPLPIIAALADGAGLGLLPMHWWGTKPRR